MVLLFSPVKLIDLLLEVSQMHLFNSWWGCGGLVAEQSDAHIKILETNNCLLPLFFHIFTNFRALFFKIIFSHIVSATSAIKIAPTRCSQCIHTVEQILIWHQSLGAPKLWKSTVRDI